MMSYGMCSPARVPPWSRKKGKLSVLGRVEAYAAKASLQSTAFQNADLIERGVYGLGLKEFTLVFNRSKDGKKYMTLGCADQAQGASAAGLVCDLYSGVPTARKHCSPIPMRSCARKNATWNSS